MVVVNFNANAFVYHEKNVVNTKYLFVLGLVVNRLPVKNPPKKLNHTHIVWLKKIFYIFIYYLYI